MGSLLDVHTESYYFSPCDNVVRDFFIPVLKNSDQYDRATGFFTSASLVEMSVGICDLASRSGKIRLITSPRLNQEDIEAIRKGYDLKKCIGEAMVHDFDKPTDVDSINRLSLIAELIACGTLEIKIAVMKNLDDYPNAIFHPKFGIMYDSFGNMISFTGSMNETKNGMGGNWESVEVSSSLDSLKKVEVLQKKFADLWSGLDETVAVIEMPDVVDDLLSTYRTGEMNLDLDQKLLRFYESRLESVFFKSPPDFVMRPYQNEAVKAWIDSGYHGIFNMATGTGKTKTALCALEMLYNSHPSEGIFTIVVAPQKHLVNQWADEIRRFNVIPILGHSDSPEKNWKDKFKSKVMMCRRNPGNYCLVTTISSFVSDDIQKWIGNIKNLAIVLDEAHNMGSELRLTKLPENATYRLALSATIERYGDSEGTASLREYFGEECINFPIEEAIGTYLTNYNYHPIVCVYNDDEYIQFINNNERLDSILSNPCSTKYEILKAKREYIEYSYTLNIQMNSKYEALRILLNGDIRKDHLLIYCGKAKTDPEGDFEETSHGSMVDSIDKVIQIIGKKGLGLDISRITYRESADDRKRIIDEFDRGETSAIAAISCLDEGVDIPSITSAILMSSSNNPREYVQRRGRVLRLHPGKNHSEIYDMVVMPRVLDSVNYSDSHRGLELKMIAKELERMLEFSRICDNPAETDNLFKQIEKSYGISIERIVDEYGEDMDE